MSTLTAVLKMIVECLVVMMAVFMTIVMGAILHKIAQSYIARYRKYAKKAALIQQLQSKADSARANRHYDHEDKIYALMRSINNNNISAQDVNVNCV